MPKLSQRYEGYPEEYRRSVVRRVNPRSHAGGYAAVARAEQVPERTVRRWHHEWLQTGRVAALAHSGGRRPFLTWAETQSLYRWLDNDNTLSNQQLASQVLRYFGKRIAPRTISDYLSGADPPFVRLTASLADPDVLTDATVTQRIRFSRRRARVPRARQAYADEKFFYLLRPATRVRGRRGSRQWVVAPYRSKRVLFFCALTERGWFAAKLVDASLNDQTFTEWALEDLTPQLRRDDVLYIDQLGKGRARQPSSSHYNPRFLRAVARRRASVEHTPRKSPQANPIELMFNYLESAVRRSAPATFDGLWRVIRQRLNSITPEMIRGWFDRRATDHDMLAQERALGIDRCTYAA
jgi:transposase